MVQFAFVDRGGRLVTVRHLVDRTSFNARCDSSSRYIRDHDRSSIFQRQRRGERSRGLPCANDTVCECDRDTNEDQLVTKKCTLL